MSKQKTLPAVYGLYINLDERGDFQADVRDLNDKTVFEVSGETAFELVEDGFMKDIRDPDAYESYMQEAGIIPNGGHVYGMEKFEQLQDRYLKMKNENKAVKNETDLGL